jgi:hypothetical protein
MISTRVLNEMYQQGHNISRLLRGLKNIEFNSEEVIETAYDLQTGSYIAGMEDEAMAEHMQRYSREIAETILSLCTPASILEAGVGEATTLSHVTKQLKIETSIFGFDLSWSRIALARSWLYKQGIQNATLCTGSLFHIPFADNSIEVVYTSHSIEPNGGFEKPILSELFRITRGFLILLEPGYELANDAAKHRMESHGYCKNLRETAESLGYQIIEHQLFPFSSNPLNPTAITIIKKCVDTDKPSYTLACPKFRTRLMKIGGMLFSEEALVVYPVLGGIPCLRIENGILASKYKEIMLAETDQRNYKDV